MADFFINPYTFVPINNKAPERKTVEESLGKLSGKISCTMEIVSPTFIPNSTLKNKKNEHQKKVFYSYEDLSKKDNEKDYNNIKRPDNPVIPASEIRGMLRNVYEQLTNSCFSQIDEFNLPYKRVNEPKIPYILKYNKERGTAILYDIGNISKIGENVNNAIAIKGNCICRGNDVTLIKCANKDNRDYYYKNVYNCSSWGNTKVNIREINDKSLKIEFNKEGKYYFHLPVNFYNGRFYNKQIIYKDPELIQNINKYEVKKEDVDRFINTLSDRVGGYISIAKTSNEDNKKIYSNYKDKMMNGEPIIVYVNKDWHEDRKKRFINDKIKLYLSMTSLGKEFFGNGIENLLSTEANNYHAQCSSSSLCPACRLFGMVAKEDTFAAKGKIKITDGVKFGDVKYEETITLPNLASPKISSTEFYLLRPNNSAGMWNYDYHTIYKDEYINGRNQTLYQREYVAPKLAGRKVYWNNYYKIESVEPTKMNETVTPIKKGCMFKFDIVFDKLTKEELNNLLFSIKLKDTENTSHRIGTGKPLGMGQVKIYVDKKDNNEQVILSKYIKDNSGIRREDAYYKEYVENITLDAKQIIRYSIITDFDNVKYPTTADNGPTFEWFANNRGNLNKQIIDKTLPNINVNPRLELNCKQQRNKNTNQNNNNRNNNNNWNNNNKNQWNNNNKKYR